MRTWMRTWMRNFVLVGIALVGILYLRVQMTNQTQPHQKPISRIKQSFAIVGEVNVIPDRWSGAGQSQPLPALKIMASPSIRQSLNVRAYVIFLCVPTCSLSFELNHDRYSEVPHLISLYGIHMIDRRSDWKESGSSDGW